MKDQTLWEKVCSYQNLRLAWNKVKENAGGPGVDHITLEEFERNCPYAEKKSKVLNTPKCIPEK